MVPVSSSRTVTAQRPGSEAMISEIHRQRTVGMPTTARATMPPSGDEDPLPERWAYALPAGPSSAPAEAPADPHTVDRRCREARMSSRKVDHRKNSCRSRPAYGRSSLLRCLIGQSRAEEMVEKPD